MLRIPPVAYRVHYRYPSVAWYLNKMHNFYSVIATAGFKPSNLRPFVIFSNAIRNVTIKQFNKRGLIDTYKKGKLTQKQF